MQQCTYANKVLYNLKFISKSLCIYVYAHDCYKHTVCAKYVLHMARNIDHLVVDKVKHMSPNLFHQQLILVLKTPQIYTY